MSGPAPDPDPSIQRELTSRWPGRREQVGQLLGLLGAPHDHAVPIFVHGPPVTGKSSIVRDVFTALGRPFAYVSLVDAHGPRLLLDAIVEELRPWLKHPTSHPPARCDRLADLVTTLRRGIRADSPAIYLVIDEATRLLDWKGETQLLPALMKLSELTGRNVGTVLVATPGWDAFRSSAGVRVPMPVFFDAYNDAQLRAILTRELPPGADAQLYRNFITSILPMFTATCKSLHELRALLSPLWRRYVGPWERAKASIDEALERRREEKENAGASAGDADVEGGGAEGVPTSAEAEKAWEAANLPRLPQPAELFFALTTSRGGWSAGTFERRRGGCRRGCRGVTRLSSRSRRRPRTRGGICTRGSPCQCPQPRWRWRGECGPCPRTRATAGSSTLTFRG
jgi:origin recognition complex subunit 5